MVDDFAILLNVVVQLNLNSKVCNCCRYIVCFIILLISLTNEYRWTPQRNNGDVCLNLETLAFANEMYYGIEIFKCKNMATHWILISVKTILLFCAQTSALREKQ